MEEIIKEGALRLLTSEASCDVILSCQGQRMMAHRIMLSIASPVLQDLLQKDDVQPAVLIFPDICGSAMSLVLDYIYTGCVSVISSMLDEFLEVAALLKLKINLDNLRGEYQTEHQKHSDRIDDYDVNNKQQYNDYECNSVYCNDASCEETSKEVFGNSLVKKPLRKVPDLMPIALLRRRKELNKVFPSPWCPRIAPVLADPRTDHINTQLNPTIEPLNEKFQENDTNNNFRIPTPVYPKPIYPKPSYFGHHPPNFFYHPPSKENNSILSGYGEHFNVLPPLPLPHLPHHPFAFENNLPPKILPPLMEPLNLLPNLEKISPPTLGMPLIHKIENNDISVKTENGDSNQTLDIDVVKTEDVKTEDKEEKIKPFKCQDCGKSFSQLRNFKYHRSIHEGTNEFSARCLECGKLFNDRGYLSSHMKIHRDKKEYACPHCPKRFNQRVAYNMHLRIHTGVKPHECATCGKSFSRKMLLKQHQRVHTGERPYSCPECGKSFADRSNMSLHARLHTGIKPYACTLCPKSFTKKHHLKTHMNFHTGLKPYSCAKCGLSFSQSSNMRTHYKKCILKPNIEKPSESIVPANFSVEKTA